MRWMSGTTDQRQIVFLNEVLNVVMFPLGSKKELLLKLMMVCSSGNKKRYSWISYKTGEKKKKKSVELIASHYNLSLREAEDTLKLFSVEEILELGESYGMQKDELKDLKKEMNA